LCKVSVTIITETLHKLYIYLTETLQKPQNWYAIPTQSLKNWCRDEYLGKFIVERENNREIGQY